MAPLSSRLFGLLFLLGACLAPRTAGGEPDRTADAAAKPPCEQYGQSDACVQANLAWKRAADEKVLAAFKASLFKIDAPVPEWEELLPEPPRRGFNDIARRRLQEYGVYAQTLGFLKAGNNGSPEDKKRVAEGFNLLADKLDVFESAAFGSGGCTFATCDLRGEYIALRLKLGDEEYDELFVDLRTKAVALGGLVDENLAYFREHGRFPKEMRDLWAYYKRGLERFSTLAQVRQEDFDALSAITEKYQKYFDVADWIEGQKIDWNTQDREFKENLIAGKDLGLFGKRIAADAADTRQLRFFAAKFQHMSESGATHDKLMSFWDAGKARLGDRMDEVFAVTNFRDVGKMIDYLNAQEAARAKGVKFEGVANPAFRGSGKPNESMMKRFAGNFWKFYFPASSGDRFEHLNNFQRARVNALVRKAAGYENAHIGDKVELAMKLLTDRRIADWRKENPGKNLPPEIQRRIEAGAREDVFGVIGSPTDKTIQAAIAERALERENNVRDGVGMTLGVLCPDPCGTALELAIRNVGEDERKMLIAMGAVSTVFPGFKLVKALRGAAGAATKQAARWGAEKLALKSGGDGTFAKLLDQYGMTRSERDVVWLKEEAPKLLKIEDEIARMEKLPAGDPGRAGLAELKGEHAVFQRRIDQVRTGLAMRQVDDYLKPYVESGAAKLELVDPKKWNDWFVKGDEFPVRPMSEDMPMYKVTFTGPVEMCSGRGGKNIGSITMRSGNFFGPCLSSRNFLTPEQLQRANATPDSNTFDYVSRFRINASPENPVTFYAGGIAPVRSDGMSKLAADRPYYMSGKNPVGGGGPGGFAQFTPANAKTHRVDGKEIVEVFDETVENSVDKAFRFFEKYTADGRPLLEHVRSVPVPQSKDPVFQQAYLSLTGRYKIAMEHGDKKAADELFREFQALQSDLAKKIGGSARPDDVQRMADLGRMEDFFRTYMRADFDVKPYLSGAGRAGRIGNPPVVKVDGMALDVDGVTYPLERMNPDSGVKEVVPMFNGKPAVDSHTGLPKYVDVQVMKNAELGREDRIARMMLPAGQGGLGVDKATAEKLFQKHEEIPCVVGFCSDLYRTKIQAMEKAGVDWKVAKECIRLGLCGNANARLVGPEEARRARELLLGAGSGQRARPNSGTLTKFESFDEAYKKGDFLGDDMYVSFDYMGGRVPARVSEKFPNGDIKVTILKEGKEGIETESRVIKAAEVKGLNFGKSSTSKEYFDELNLPIKRRGAFRNWNFSMVGPTEVMTNAPGGQRILHHLGDSKVSEKIIVDFRSRAPPLRPGSYTWVFLEDGRTVLGRVEDSWEIGSKHFQLAQGRVVRGAGELKVLLDGRYQFNVESGTFSKEIQDFAAQEGGDPRILEEASARHMEQIFGRGGEYVGREKLLPENPPSSAQIKKYCSSPEFQKLNPAICS